MIKFFLKAEYKGPVIFLCYIPHGTTHKDVVANSGIMTYAYTFHIQVVLGFVSSCSGTGISDGLGFPSSPATNLAALFPVAGLPPIDESSLMC